MPNGGLLPSCLVCRWVEKNEDYRQDVHGVHCQRHSMDITTSPIFTFCSDLSLINENEQPGRLVTENKLTGEDVYIWVELGYTTNEYPGLPQYHQEYALLAPIKVYADWSKEQRQIAVQTIYDEKRKEFLAKYGGEAIHSTTLSRGIRRILNWFRKLSP